MADGKISLNLLWLNPMDYELNEFFDNLGRASILDV